MAVEPRRERYGRIEAEQRWGLLADDIDANERDLRNFKNEVRGKLDSINAKLWAALFGLAMASAVGLLNLIYMKAGG